MIAPKDNPTPKPRKRRAKAKTKELAELTPREQLYVQFYLSNGFIGWKAALDAGYNEKDRGNAGSRLRKRPDVRKAIEAELEARGATNERCIKRFLDIAFEADIADFSDYLSGKETLAEARKRGIKTSVIESAKQTTRTSRGTAKGETITAVTRSIKFHDSMRAAEKVLMAVMGITSHVADGALDNMADATIMEIIEVQMRRCRVALPRGLGGDEPIDAEVVPAGGNGEDAEAEGDPDE